MQLSEGERGCFPRRSNHRVCDLLCACHLRGLRGPERSELGSPRFDRFGMLLRLAALSCSGQSARYRHEVVPVVLNASSPVALPNKGFEFVPCGRPTRKLQGRLLAAHPRRYA